jgi:hypothetical protein
MPSFICGVINNNRISFETGRKKAETLVRLAEHLNLLIIRREVPPIKAGLVEKISHFQIGNQSGLSFERMLFADGH